MWQKFKPLLIILSVALNVAFVSVWAVRALPQRLGLARETVSPRSCADCTLHRELGTTEAQRRQMEPGEIAYLQSTRALCNRAQELRGQIIDLIAAPTVDRAAITVRQDSILAIQRDIQVMLVEHLLSQKQALNAEQQHRLFSLMRRRCGCNSGGCINPEMRNLPTIP